MHITSPISSGAPAMPTDSIQDAYTAAVVALREAGELLRPAVAARYEAPPQGAVRQPAEGTASGVPNPTLDIVLDPRRMELSDTIGDMTKTLRRAASDLSAATAHLNVALARWEGQPVPE